MVVVMLNYAGTEARSSCSNMIMLTMLVSDADSDTRILGLFPSDGLRHPNESHNQMITGRFYDDKRWEPPLEDVPSFTPMLTFIVQGGWGVGARFDTVTQARSQGSGEPQSVRVS
eukprot:3940247-Rhodomonas_salina.1